MAKIYKQVIVDDCDELYTIINKKTPKEILEELRLINELKKLYPGETLLGIALRLNIVPSSKAAAIVKPKIHEKVTTEEISNLDVPTINKNKFQL